MTVRFFRSQKLISEVDCYQSLNLLGHAQLEETETGSECGGHGKCGKDRVLIAESDRLKLNAPTFAELKFLSSEQLLAGWRLACQAFPNQDGLDIAIYDSPSTNTLPCPSNHLCKNNGLPGVAIERL